MEVLPINRYYEVIERFKSGDIAGVFYQNGPGDPLILEEEQEKIHEVT